MEERKGFGSNFGFIMAAVGSAVGLGNIWGFPNKMGASGGALFLIIYLILAVFCGFIMTTVVNFGRKGQWLPLLFGIPLFIVCGFVHSIADAFYYLLGVEPAGFTAPVLMAYLASVVGNFIGCNAYRIFQRLAA